MPGVRCEAMCKTSVPDVLCEVRSSVSLPCLRCEVLCEVWGSVRGVHFCVMFCARYGVLLDVLREVWISVFRYSVLGMEFCVICSA
jgi:hypothetical protein